MKKKAKLPQKELKSHKKHYMVTDLNSVDDNFRATLNSVDDFEDIFDSFASKISN